MASLGWDRSFHTLPKTTVFDTHNLRSKYGGFWSVDAEQLSAASSLIPSGLYSQILTFFRCLRQFVKKVPRKI